MGGGQHMFWGAARGQELFAWGQGTARGWRQGLSGSWEQPRGRGWDCKGLGGRGGLELWLFCFPLWRPKGQGCRRSGHMCSHKRHGHSPHWHPTVYMPIPAWPRGAPHPAWPRRGSLGWPCCAPAPRERQGGPSSKAVHGGGAWWRCMHSWRCLPTSPSWGEALKISLPPAPPPSPSPTTMLLLACAPGNAIPANFPASRSPASLRNYSAWQLPSLCELLCGAFAARMVVVLLILTRFPGLRRWRPRQPCQAASHRCTAVAQLLQGCWVASPLHGRSTASAWPWHDRCTSTAWAPTCTAATKLLRGHCVSIAWPVNDQHTATV